MQIETMTAAPEANEEPATMVPPPTLSSESQPEKPRRGRPRKKRRSTSRKSSTAPSGGGPLDLPQRKKPTGKRPPPSLDGVEVNDGERVYVDDASDLKGMTTGPDGAEIPSRRAPGALPPPEEWDAALVSQKMMATPIVEALQAFNERVLKVRGWNGQQMETLQTGFALFMYSKAQVFTAEGYLAVTLASAYAPVVAEILERKRLGSGGVVVPPVDSYAIATKGSDR